MLSGRIIKGASPNVGVMLRCTVYRPMYSTPNECSRPTIQGSGESEWDTDRYYDQAKQKLSRDRSMDPTLLTGAWKTEQNGVYSRQANYK